MNESLGSVSEVLDLLRGRADALAAIGISKEHLRVMRSRDRIPAHWDRAIVSAAKRHRLPITYALLARLRQPPIRGKGRVNG